MKRRLTDIAKISTFGNTGQVEVLCLNKREELEKLNFIPFVIGCGSNLLISDNSKKIFLNTSNFNFIEESSNYIKLGSGVNTNTFLRYCIDKQIKGFEFLAGIPGTIGGLVTMNAGSWGSEICEKIFKVISFDVSKKIFIERIPEECDFSYRSSCFKKNREIITEIVLYKENSLNSEEIKNNIRENYVKKLKSQPVLKKTFGSVFKNPENFSSWKLLKECGLQNLNKNGAKFSSKHANFIVNSGNASFDDVKYLIEKAKETVFQKRGILLEEEVVIVE